MKVEMDVLCPPSIIILMVSLDVKQHNEPCYNRAQELCSPSLIVLMVSLAVKLH